MTDSKRSDAGREREKRYLYWFCRIPSLGAVSLKQLMEASGGWEAAYYMEETQLRETGLLKEHQIADLREAKPGFAACCEEYERLGERQIRFVTSADEEYPERLREIYDYPMGIFVRGKLPAAVRPALAVVGARGCSAYGEQLAREFARALAAEGMQIISGLALGIDGAAHRGALDAGGATFGVLGCGVNICYPSSHYKLYEAMLADGGILSEFPLDMRPLKRNFPMRNRIISGLADAVLVVEAREKSGSLITAEFGLEQGREVFAVPGRVTDCLSIGCNQLIQQGAHMAISPGDIIEILGINIGKTLIIHEKDVKTLAKKEKMVYSCLDFKPKHLEAILAGTGLGVSECMGILLELELGGYVFRSANHYYGKRL